MPEHYYHLIGKAAEKGELLFREEEDYLHFLQRTFKDQLHVVFQFLVYCLLPNHFHAVIRTRPSAYVLETLRERDALGFRLTASQRKFLNGQADYKTLVKNTFSGATAGYAAHYNHKYERTGQLFLRPTLHGLTTKGPTLGRAYSRTLGAYVGLNYAKHGYAAHTDFYGYSSLRNPLYHICELDIPHHYGSDEAYKQFHLQYMRTYGATFYNFDEDQFFAALTQRRYNAEAARWEIGDWY